MNMRFDRRVLGTSPSRSSRGRIILSRVLSRIFFVLISGKVSLIKQLSAVNLISTKSIERLKLIEYITLKNGSAILMVKKLSYNILNSIIMETKTFSLINNVRINIFWFLGPIIACV